MTALLPSPARPQDQDGESVALWLRANPGFLAARPELYAALDPPTRLHGDRLADHMQARIDAGTMREAALAREIEELVAAGRANMLAAGRVQRAVLALQGAADPLALIPTLAELLGVESVTLCAERPAPQNFRTLPEGTVAQLLAGRDAVLRDAPIDCEMLHGEAAPLIASDALLRMGGARPALLVLGAREQNTFQPGQATDLLQFLAASVSAALGRA